MRGHDSIISLRMQGLTPAFVFIDDYPSKDVGLGKENAFATVCTHGDSLTSLDFRFLVGLKVSISATSEHRAKSLFCMAKYAGAVLVGASHLVDGVHPSEQNGWCEVYAKEAVCG